MSTQSSTVYFWRETVAETGYLSQWFASPFTDDKDPSIFYKTAEHYMMYQKAILFNDTAIAARTLTAKHPRDVKSLGRKVKNFDQDVWVANRERIVFEGNMLKFRDETLKAQLLATGDAEIVEASPYDDIWGIGYREEHADAVRADWGQNLLGKALMEVRKQLNEKE